MLVRAHGYTSEAIKGYSAAYELTGTYKRGLKTSTSFWSQNSGNPSQFASSPDRTETYTYDDQRDFLASATYNDGQSPSAPVWTYDARGNRYSGTCYFDSLNQQNECSGYWYMFDKLGNRTQRKNKTTNAVTSYTWDELNRMTGTSAWTYTYRADGMRTLKRKSNEGTQFRYDGQMGIQDIDYTGTTLGTWVATTNYGLGARGIDVMEKTTSTGTSTYYPLYDIHGNNMFLLSKSGTSWSLSNGRTYGVWGEVRTEQAAGAPSGRYVASIGHKADDESGLIYMRARYYEPARGRFISEDTARQWINWYSYCGNNPVQNVDYSGKNFMMHFMLFFFSAPTLVAMGALFDPTVAGPVGPLIAFGVLNLIVAAWSATTHQGSEVQFGIDALEVGGSMVLGVMGALAANGAAAAGAGVAKNAVYFYTGYSLLILGMLIGDMVGDLNEGNTGWNG